jgi:hypothetical protein
MSCAANFAAAFTHLVMLASETVTAPTVDESVAATRGRP